MAGQGAVHSVATWLAFWWRRGRSAVWRLRLPCACQLRETFPIETWVRLAAAWPAWQHLHATQHFRKRFFFFSSPNAAGLCPGWPLVASANCKLESPEKQLPLPPPGRSLPRPPISLPEPFLLDNPSLTPLPPECL